MPPDTTGWRSQLKRVAEQSHTSPEGREKGKVKHGENHASKSVSYRLAELFPCAPDAL